MTRETFRSSITSALFICLLAFSAGEAWGQSAVKQSPDCLITFDFTATGHSNQMANYGSGSTTGAQLCDTWTLAYENTGFSAISLRFESANAATSTTPGAFGAYAGTVNVGINPNTSTTGAQSKFTNGAVGIAWVQVALNTATGSGHVKGMLQGWNSGNGNSAGAGPGGGGGGGGCSSPCPVEGVDAAGSPPTVPPVPSAGTDGTNIRAIRTDTTGRPVVVGAAAAGAAVAGNPVLTGGKDTAGNAESLLTDVTGKILEGAYPTNASVSLTTSGLTRIVTHSGSNTNTVSHFSIAFASAVNFQFEYGTGSNCGTGTTALTGVYQSIVGLALDVAFLVPAGQDLCANLGTSVTGGGFIVYSQP